MQFIIFHGSFGSAEGNWFPQLKEQLESLGQKVIIPEFPIDDWDEITKNGQTIPPEKQILDKWLKVFEDVYSQLDTNEKICFIGHSLGCLFILHIVSKFNIQLDSAIFVSPFFDTLHKDWQIDHVNRSFYKIDFDFGLLKELIPISYVLYSDNDPYVNKNHSILFAKALDSSMIYVRRAGHMNSEVNLNEFPLIADLCYTRLDLSLYQKYMAHRKELFSVNYIKGTSEEMIYLKPEEVIDEGVFKFRNLHKEGFCTYYTPASNFWDPNSTYMNEARKAAKRTKNLIRVFLINNTQDLNQPSLREQIELDLKAEVRVYICSINEIEDKVKQLDFGIWDNEYVCFVGFNKDLQAEEVRLSSVKADMEEAQKWKEIILKKAKHIENLSQL